MRFLLYKHKIKSVYLFAVLFLIGSALFGVLLGSTRISLSELWSGLFSGDTEASAWRILCYVRLPRVLGALLCGAALSVAGAVIQGALNNPLASPSVIGVNSGAGLAVILCISSGMTYGWRLSLWAFVGAFVAVMLVSLGAKKWGASRGTVILMGVAVNALLGAVTDTVITFSPELAVQSMDFKLGDLSYVTYTKLLPAAVIILVGITASLLLSTRLELLSLGDEQATGLGLNTGALRMLLLLLAALLAGAAVSVAGVLSFVGLLVPHAVRRLFGGKGHFLFLCVFLGGGFLCLCDTLSRTLFSPFELPVGILMAFLGAPFFLWILLRGRGNMGHA